MSAAFLLHSEHVFRHADPPTPTHTPANLSTYPSTKTHPKRVLFIACANKTTQANIPYPYISHQSNDALATMYWTRTYSVGSFLSAAKVQQCFTGESVLSSKQGCMLLLKMHKKGFKGDHSQLGISFVHDEIYQLRLEPTASLCLVAMIPGRSLK